MVYINTFDLYTTSFSYRIHYSKLLCNTKIARKLYARILLESVNPEVTFNKESFERVPETFQNFLYLFQMQWTIFRIKISRRLYKFGYMKPVVWEVKFNFESFETGPGTLRNISVSCITGRSYMIIMHGYCASLI